MPSGNFPSVLQCWRWRWTRALVCCACLTKWVIIAHNIWSYSFFFINIYTIRCEQIQKSYPNNNLHWRHRRHTNENSGEGPKYIQHCNRREQHWFCVSNATPLDGSRTLSTFHITRPEFGLGVAGIGSFVQISTRCFHRYDGLCIRNAIISLHWRLSGRLLHALSHHQYRYATKGSKSSLCTQ